MQRTTTIQGRVRRRRAKRRGTLVLLALAPLVSCATPMTRGELPPARDLPEAEVVPHDSDLTGDQIKVVLAIETLFADQLGVREDLLKGVLRSMNAIGVEADTNAAPGVTKIYSDVIELATRNTNEEYGGAQKYNYVVRGQLTESKLEKSYSKPSWLKRGENPPGKCEYETSVGLTLEAIALPKVRRAKGWVLTTSTSKSIEAHDVCPDERTGVAHAAFVEARRDAIEKLAGCVAVPLREFFAPRAHVLAYYSDGQKHFFEISGGSAAGFDPNDVILFERQLPEARGGGMVFLGKGRVTTLVERKRAAVEVTDLEAIGKIKKHDRVHVKSVSILGGTWNSLTCRSTIVEH